MLDLDHGTYPFITSSSTTAGGACTGTRRAAHQDPRRASASPRPTARAWARGPSPPSCTGEIADLLRARGNEYGAVTGRPRRCGWADAVGLRYAVRINGIDTLAVTKLDVLDACETVKICTGYRYQGDVLTEFPEEERIWHEAEPVYEELSGWQTDHPGASRLLTSCPPRRASISSGSPS